MKKKKWLIVMTVTAIALLLLVPEFASADVTTNIQNSQTKIFSFFKGISWYIYGVLMILLLVVKQAAHGQGNDGGEQKAKMGLWGITIAEIAIYWGSDILDTVKGWFQ